MTTTHEPPLERFMPLSEVAPLFGRKYEWLLAQAKGPLKPFVSKVGREYFMTASQVRAAQKTFVNGEPAPERDPHGLRPRSRAHLNGGGKRR